MENENNRNQLMMSLLNVEYHPILSEDTELSVVSSFELSDISSLGTSFLPIANAMKSVMDHATAEQLYKFDYRGHVGEMTKFKDGSGFLSTITKPGEGVIGQGAYVPTNIPFDTTSLVMAIALASIEKKLDEIKDVQQDILEILQLQEKAKLKANHYTLNEIMNNFKHNWNNEKFINSKINLVQNIKKESEQSIIFHRDRVKNKLSKGSLFNSDQDVKKKLNEVVAEMKDYQLALYLYSFADFLEVVLLGNFKSEFLNDSIKRCENYSYEYRSLYTKVYNNIEKKVNSSVQSVLLSGVAGFNKIVGKTVSKVPFLEERKIDEAIIESAKKVDTFNSKRSIDAISQLKNVQNSVVSPFVNNLKTLDLIYNQSSELILDSNKLYLVTDKNELE
ncbi:MAG: hypothetical protein RR565_01460 [Erysipelothrix sp.]